jgi:hypothetical protein
MEKYLNINQGLAARIFELTANERLTMLTDFQPLLTEEEFNAVENKLQNLDQRAFQWFIETTEVTSEVEEPVPV